MTPRDTDRRESVVSEIIKLLGAGPAAHAIGKSESTLYAAGDERQTYMLADDDFLTLDAACMERRGVAPYHRWWGRQIAKRTGAATREAQELEGATLDVSAALGRLSECVQVARCPRGEGGREITPRERTAIKHATKQIREECDDVDLAADAGVDPAQIVHDLAGARERGGQG